MKIKVTSPATSANLACGFDSFGAAFGLYDLFLFETGEGKLVIKDTNEKYSNEKNLAYRAFLRASEILGKKIPLVRMETVKADIPFSRGLGSSSALIVAGVMASARLSGVNLTKQESVEIATEIEGHPDNVAPCIFGGFTASAKSEGKVITSRFLFHDSLKFAAIIPPYKLFTVAVRGVLPKTVPFTDAVYNLSRTAILSDGLISGDADKIRFAMDDRLHQPYRKKLIPEYEEIEKICLSKGAISFAISGAGPTMLTVFGDDSVFSEIKNGVSEKFPEMKVIPLSPDNSGSFVTEEI